MNSASAEWDPMLEDFRLSRELDELHEDLKWGNEDDEKECEGKILIQYLPVGITLEGIRNLCHAAGKAISIYVFQNGRSAIVKFKTVREAELAIRNLNKTPPYSLKVSFAESDEDTKDDKENKSGSVTSSHDQENDEGWVYQKSHGDSSSSEVARQNLTQDVPPYFPYCCEFDDPSLVMRQNNLDFKTPRECVSMGRGYLNMGDVDRYAGGNKLFSRKSGNVDHIKKLNCPVCGMMSFGVCDSSYRYCSNECEFKASKLKRTKSQSIHTKIFDLIAPEDEGTIEFINEPHEVRVPCCIILEKQQPLYERMKKLSNEPGQVVSAMKGDIVLVHNDKAGFLRGIVLNEERSIYKVALVDFGEVVSAKKVYEISDSLREIVSFGGMAVCLGNGSFNSKSVKFRVRERKPFGSWICDVIDPVAEEDVREIMLEKWIPPTNLTYVPLESGCSVVISAFINMNTVFVRRIDRPWMDDFVRLCNDVAIYSLEAGKYKRLPKYGEICSARYSQDGCYHRAVVRAVERNSVTVAFVDYGNQEETNLENLCYLPTTLKQTNCFAVRVRLKNVSSASTPETVNYLNRLTAFSIELDLTYAGKNSGEVVLTERCCGEIVNKKLADLAIPTWKITLSYFTKAGEVHNLEDIGEVSFKCGDNEDIFVLKVDINEFSNNGIFWATVNRGDYLGHLNGQLKQHITEFCNLLEHDPYLPRKDELCHVKYSGEWCRAVCLENKDLSCQVFLIDFGITTWVETRNIRKTSKDFLEMPALALKCTISGLQNLNEDEKMLLTEHLMESELKLMKNVKILKKVAGLYHLSIPFTKRFEDLSNTK